MQSTFQLIENPDTHRYIYVHGQTFNKLLANNKYTEAFLLSQPSIVTHKKPKSPLRKLQLSVQLRTPRTSIVENPDVDLEILLNTPDNTLQSLCIVNQYYNNLCHSKDFFFKKLEQWNNQKNQYGRVDTININDIALLKSKHHIDYFSLYLIIRLYRKLMSYEEIKFVEAEFKDLHENGDPLTDYKKLLNEYGLAYKYYYYTSQDKTLKWYYSKDAPVFKICNMITLRPYTKLQNSNKYTLVPFMNFFIHLLYYKFMELVSITDEY